MQPTLVTTRDITITVRVAAHSFDATEKCLHDITTAVVQAASRKVLQERYDLVLPVEAEVKVGY